MSLPSSGVELAAVAEARAVDDHTVVQERAAIRLPDRLHPAADTQPVDDAKGSLIRRCLAPPAIASENSGTPPTPGRRVGPQC